MYRSTYFSIPPPPPPPPPTSELVASDSPAVLSHLSDGAPDTANDLLLAQMLQLEFDREHDSQVKAEERHMNKRSKGERGREGGGFIGVKLLVVCHY